MYDPLIVGGTLHGEVAPARWVESPHRYADHLVPDRNQHERYMRFGGFWLCIKSENENVQVLSVRSNESA